MCFFTLQTPNVGGEDSSYFFATLVQKRLMEPGLDTFHKQILLVLQAQVHNSLVQPDSGRMYPKQGPVREKEVRIWVPRNLFPGKSSFHLLPPTPYLHSASEGEGGGSIAASFFETPNCYSVINRTSPLSPLPPSNPHSLKKLYHLARSSDSCDSWLGIVVRSGKARRASWHAALFPTGEQIRFSVFTC